MFIYSAGSGEEDEVVANSPQQAQEGEKTGQSTEYEEWTLGDSKEHTPVPTEEIPIGTVRKRSQLCSNDSPFFALQLVRSNI